MKKILAIGCLVAITIMSVGVVNAAKKTKYVLGGDYELRAACTDTYAQGDVYAYNENYYPVGSATGYYTYNGDTYTISLPGTSYQSYWSGSRTISASARFYKTTTRLTKSGTTYSISASN